MDHFTLPEAKFGMSNTNFNVGCMPLNLPQAEAIIAANKLNTHRFYGLTHQQRCFVDSYLSNGFDATQAAKDAYYALDDSGAARHGRRLMKKDYILKAIDLALVYYTAKSKFYFDKNKYLFELEKLAMSNMGDYWKNDGMDDPYLSMPDNDDRDKMACVQSIKVKSYAEGKGASAREVKEVEFKLYDKAAALKELIRLADAHNNDSSANALLNAADAAKDISNQPIVVFEIVGVPTGEFIPAPESPYKTIEHQIDGVN